MRHGVPQPRQDRLPRHTTLIQLQVSCSGIIQAIADGNSILTPTEAHAIVARLLACFIEQIYNLNGVCLTNKEE